MATLEELLSICILADEYHSVASDFHKGYVYLSKANMEKFDPEILYHYLLCHALEVALKGWLILEGDDPDVLARRIFGHDLGAIIQRVFEKYGADSFPPAFAEMVTFLNTNYKGKDYEYPPSQPLMVIRPLEHFEQFVDFSIKELARKSLAKRLSAYEPYDVQD